MYQVEKRRGLQSLEVRTRQPSREMAAEAQGAPYHHLGGPEARVVSVDQSQMNLALVHETRLRDGSLFDIEKINVDSARREFQSDARPLETGPQDAHLHGALRSSLTDRDLDPPYGGDATFIGVLSPISVGLSSLSGATCQSKPVSAVSSGDHLGRKSRH